MKDKETINLAFKHDSVQFLYAVDKDSENLLVDEYGRDYAESITITDLPELVEDFSVLIVD